MTFVQVKNATKQKTLSMTTVKKLFLLILLLAGIPKLKATHIVGGELNYTYNGGSSYTIKLRLYRDCGSGTASFPANVTISVRGNNGATFSPSKDFNMSLGTVSNVPSNQLPCAVPPNPSPCVQVGTYSITVNNLPPNVGGYHLFYQVTARNLSLTNINGACNCIGESFYAYIPNNTVASNSNNNAVFTNLPPLFLCVNQPFAFNHSATDADGDSLAYSLYAPYNGDNGTGPLDPTFPANTASFTPVTYLAGYTSNNPLGASPFNLNPVTGMLTGTPGMVGQFVVGVKVKEFRNGVFISQTLRDFQFNVLNCPQPPPTLAVNDFSINNGCAKTVTAGGVLPSSINWTSIAPGAQGAYNSFLSCTSGCLSTTISATGTPPPFVDFKVCGTSTSCAGNTICDTFRVYFNPTLSVSISPSNPVLCFGQTATTITATGSGGTPPYSYLWNNVNPSQTINVGSGTYNVALSDATGCPPVYSSIIITSYSTPIIASAGPDIIKCNQSPIATLNGSVSGASGGLWSGGTGTFSPGNTTLSNLNYIPTPAEVATGSVALYLTTTGNGACPADVDTIVINYAGFTGTITPTFTPVSCFGGTNGIANVSVNGAFAPFQYTWTSVPAQTGSVATGLGIGTYTVFLKNAIGCTNQATVSITQPSPVNIVGSTSMVSCFGGNNGIITTSATGGNPSYTYSWSPGGQTTSSVTSLTAGTYTLKATDSKGCISNSAFVITQPSVITLTTSQANVNCFNGNNGAASVIASGGTSPFTYSWTPGGATTASISNLTAGNYTVIVKDNKGCSSTKTLSITQPPALTLTVTKTNETCNNLNNGTASGTITGGTPGYTYQWLPSGAATNSVSGLSSGNYTLNVNDSKGCSSSTVITITEPPSLISSFAGNSPVSCFGGSNGSVTANPSGGTPGYTYLWSPGSFTTASANNLSAGNYTVTVVDSKSCSITGTVSILQPLPLNVAPTYTNVLCSSGSNGAISISASGGTAPYNHLLMPGNITGVNFSNLPAGIYTVTTNDAKNCTASTTVNINQPTNFSSIASFTNSTCNLQTGVASISVTSGGLPPFTYTWLPAGGNGTVATNLAAGSYTVNINDGNGCTASQIVNINDDTGPVVNIASTSSVSCFGGNNGSAVATFTGGTGPSFTYSWSPTGGNSLTTTGIGTGIYVLTVTDANGCIGLASTPLIAQPTQLVASSTKTNITCNGVSNGIGSIIASGGTGAFTYSWTPGNYTANFVNTLSPGTYSISITDNNNCITTTSLAITEPPLLMVNSVSINSISCFGGTNGSVTATASGGTPAYNYFWTPAVSSGTTATNLSSGSYTLNITDNNGCSTQTTIIIAQPTQSLSAIASGNSVTCFGGATGSASININGGTPNYITIWNPSVSSTSVASGLTAGSYVITILDNNSCQTTTSINITQPTNVTGTLIPNNASCGLPNGSITSQISGGVGPYTYSWSPVSGITSTLGNLFPGTYSVEVSDAQACLKTFTTSLINIAGPTVSINSGTNVSCFGGNNGMALGTIVSGTSPFNINWFPYGGTATLASSLIAGNYTVIVTDALGCITTASTVITEPPILNIQGFTVTPVSCFNGNDGSIVTDVTGGLPSYTYSWTPGTANTSSISGLTAGSYTLLVKDNKNCTAVSSMTVSQPQTLTLTVTNVAQPLCYNSLGNATVTASGGNIPYSYTWTPITGQNTNVISNVPAGTYTLQTIDAKGCVAMTRVILNNPTQVITSVSSNDTICLNQFGALIANATGGAGNYSYSWMPLNIINSGTLADNPTTSTSYTVMAFDQNGCSGISATSNIIVYNFTQANVSVSGLSPICPGQISIISATTVGNTGPVNYQWNNGLGNGIGPFIVTPSNPTTYVVNVTNSCGKVISDSIHIAFNPQPTVSITSDTAKICMPEKIKLKDLSVHTNNNDPITSWNWSFGNGVFSTDQNPAITFTAAGAYSATLTVSTDAGCTGNNSTAPINFTVYPKPNAAFSVNSMTLDLPFDKLICKNLSSGADYFNWSFGDGNTSIEVHPQYLYQTIGPKDIQLIAYTNAGCSDTALISIVTIADIIFPNAFTPTEFNNEEGFYSNTSLDNDIFFPYTSGVKEYKLQVFNRWGELIFESDELAKGWNGKYRGQLCQSGVYIYKAHVKLNNGRTLNKIGDVTLLR